MQLKKITQITDEQIKGSLHVPEKRMKFSRKNKLFEKYEGHVEQDEVFSATSDEERPSTSAGPSHREVIGMEVKRDGGKERQPRSGGHQHQRKTKIFA
ncbi:6535_t:CDS:2 [Paraglomus brasilianum]|uniref:6535_t:CDS:1 n=1 Tax=Paraglomus brasilianum TaxID=144538 RepID=A0A9N9E3Q6_9GLOM|nr:6535_t:CDS:2 [Paraglomus brasilianum]